LSLAAPDREEDLMRRVLLSALISVVVVSSASADIPQVISYQGKVTDAGGTPVADGDYSMTFTIYDAETSGTSLWSSGTMTVAVSGGTFSVLLGDTGQPALNLDFDIDYWLEIDIAGDIQSPRTPLGSVGYAYMASGIVPGTEMVDSRSNPIFKGTNLGTGAGLRGDSDLGIGVRGETNATDGKGVYGAANSTTGTNYGVMGVHESSNGAAVIGFANGTSGVASGVIGYTDSPTGYGVSGRTTSSSGLNYGVFGFSNSSEGIGVYGIGNAATGTNYGVYGETNSSDGFAGYFTGRTRVTGDLTVTSGGYLGIGSNNPSNPLVISSPESDTPGDGAQIKLNDSSNENHAFALRIGSTGAGDLNLDSYNGGWQTLATIDRENGKVGLGTDTPDRDLSVVGYVRAANEASETNYTEISHGGSNAFINWGGAGDLDFRYETSTKMTVQQDGDVGIGTATPGAKLDVRGTAVFNEGGGDNDFRIEGQSKQNLLFCDASEDRIGIGTNSPSALFDVDGKGQFNRVEITGTAENFMLDVFGYIQSQRLNGDLLSRLWMDSNGAGSFGVHGPNGEKNFSVTSRSGYANHGHAYVCDSSGNPKAGMYVDSSGDGVVYADTKNFRMVNPNQPDTEIWYACIEGPEAAAYLRGTARLENGRASISFPDHFQAVATAEGMTVQLTPRSAKSRGLAVEEQSLEGIEVRELWNGTGSYEFHYTVMAVRQSYEDYRVIRPAMEERIAHVDESEM
jgi:hypothetical protein